MWYRVFGTSPAVVEPAALLEALQRPGDAVRGEFRGDQDGWFAADLVRPGAGGRYELQRYLASEEGIRDELNTWAAGIELIDTPHQAALMQHMISTQQLFTLRAVEGDGDADFCAAVCRWLAGQTAGVYQADGAGFFSPAGELLARDEA